MPLEGFVPAAGAPGFSSEGTPDRPGLPGELVGFQPFVHPDQLDGYSRGVGQATYEVGRQLVGGFASDLPRTIGKGLQFATDEGSPYRMAADKFVDIGDRAAANFAPNTVGQGAVGGVLAKGARMIGPVAPVVGASMIPGGQVAGPALAAGMFGASGAQETQDKLTSQGIAPDEARRAGYSSGLIQGPLMAASAGIGGAAFRGVSSMFGKGAAPTMESIVGQVTSQAALGPAAKSIAFNMLEQPAIMGAATAGSELVERAYGAQPENLWEKVKDSGEAAIGMTALLGPFAAMAHFGRAKVGAAFDAALNDSSAPPEIRKVAEDAIVTHAQKRGVDPAQIQDWLVQREQARQADATTQEAAPPGAYAPGTEPAGTNMMTGGTPAVVEARKAAEAETASQQQFTKTFQPNPEAPQATPVPPAPLPSVPQPGELAHPATGVDPAVLAQRQVAEQQAQQQQAAADAERTRIEQEKATILARQGAEKEASDTYTGGAVDEKGKPVKVPSNFRDAMMDMKLLMKQDLVTPERAQGFSGRLKAAFETKDLKTLQAVRKELDAIKNPAPAEEKKPAFKVTLPEKPSAPEKVPEQASVPVQPEGRAGGGEAVKAGAGDRVLNAAQGDYTKYEGRPVTLEVPNADPAKKPIRRTIKNARPALEEADDRISKFEELARCLQG